MDREHKKGGERRKGGVTVCIFEGLSFSASVLARLVQFLPFGIGSGIARVWRRLDE